MKLEKAGLYVLIAILVGGLASSPVFSSSYSAFAQYDDVDTEQEAMEKAESAIQDAKEEIEKAEIVIAEASEDGKETALSEEALDEAILKLEMAEESFAAGIYDDAEELAEQARDLASESRMTLIGKTVDDFEEHDEMGRPDVCTMEYAPVCGKDGHTYGNMCMLEASDAELAHEGECETDREDDDYYHDKDRFEEYCGMSDEEKREFLARHHDNIEEHMEKLDRFCAMTDEEREEYHKEYKDEYKDKHMDKEDYLEDKLETYCEMTDEEKREAEAKHDRLTDEMKDRLAEYCELSEDERHDYRERHHDMMMDFKKRHHDMLADMKDGYDLDDKLERYCDMTDEEKAEVEAKYDRLTDEMKDRLAEYCELSEDERDAYLDRHHDMMRDFKERHHEMVDEMQDRHKEIRMEKMMERDFKITDERKDELKMKFREKTSDLSDEERDEIRFEIEAKYDKHFKMKFKARHDAMSDLERSDLLKRHQEMRDYKLELRERHDAMTDEQRDKFRMDFYSKAEDMRHAWLSPRIQMMAGVSADQIECREGLNLIMMHSNGKPMCMKATSAERLIDRGIAVPLSE